MSKRVLVLGGSGMLGHKVNQVLSRKHETFVTLRDKELALAYPAIFSQANIIDRVDAQDSDSIARAFSLAKPDVVVNCIGVVKQLDTSKDSIISISVNSLFPHQVALKCASIGARLITISTDCVFSGKEGNYSESDKPDPEDLYGNSKLLGEVASGEALTIRTSIIGRQIQGTHALLEWFLKQKGGLANGYKHAIFTGFPTLILAHIIDELIEKHPRLTGIRHVAAQPISKFELLSLINRIFGLGVELLPEEKFNCNRSLNASLFQSETGMVPESWETMIEKMYQDQASYLVPVVPRELTGQR